MDDEYIELLSNSISKKLLLNFSVIYTIIII